MQYSGGNRYVCNFLLRSQGDPLCQHLPADLIDARVVAAFVAAVGPTELEAWTQAPDARRRVEEAFDRAEAQQVERLRYQAPLAERQYNRVDPDNRLIAAELERRWEMALRELRQAEEGLARRRAAEHEPEALTAEESETSLAFGPQLPEFWQRPDVSWADKKALLRSLIKWCCGAWLVTGSPFVSSGEVARSPNWRSSRGPRFCMPSPAALTWKPGCYNWRVKVSMTRRSPTY